MTTTAVTQTDVNLAKLLVLMADDLGEPVEPRYRALAGFAVRDAEVRISEPTPTPSDFRTEVSDPSAPSGSTEASDPIQETAGLLTEAIDMLAEIIGEAPIDLRKALLEKLVIIAQLEATKRPTASAKADLRRRVRAATQP